MEDSKRVENASGREFNSLSKELGINRVPIISRIPGMDMTRSFSMEMMHLMLENIQEVNHHHSLPLGVSD